MGRKYYSFWDLTKKANKRNKKYNLQNNNCNDQYNDYYDDYDDDKSYYDQNNDSTVKADELRENKYTSTRINQPIYHNYRRNGYYALSSNTSYFSAISHKDIIYKFLNIYKHLDDLRSIVGIESNIKLTYKKGITFKKGDTIYIDTRMFDEGIYTNDDDALNCCLGGALYAFAIHNIGLNKVGDEAINTYIDKIKTCFPEYENFILTSFPGYYGLIDAYNTFLQKHPYSQNLASPIFVDDLFTKLSTGLIKETATGYIHLSEIENIDSYKYQYEHISGFISTVANTLNKFFVNTVEKNIGCRNGILDSNKLVEAIQGAPNVYYNTQLITSPAIDICILVDESGSMSGTNIELTKAAVILINEACKNINNCNLFIYGHSADKIESGKTEIFRYKDKYVNNPHVLGSIKARAQNRDGPAIREVVTQVRTQSKNKILMFILSDGNPYADGIYHGDLAIDDTRNAVNEVEKNDVIVTQCTFKGTAVNSKQMFNRYIMIDTDDISEFVVKFVKIISTDLIKEYTS